jgi:hypothetical protein
VKTRNPHPGNIPPPRRKKGLKKIPDGKFEPDKFQKNYPGTTSPFESLRIMPKNEFYYHY